VLASAGAGQERVMGLVFLLVAVSGLLLTLNALRPIGAGRPWLSGWSWLWSWPAIELAWLVLPFQVALAGGFVLLGALFDPFGWLALAVSLLSWAGLVLVIARSVWTAHEIRSVFHQLDLPTRPRAGLAVTRIRDITYATVGRKALRLDVYRPRDADPAGERRPAVLQIHGGAWVSGDKRTQGLPLLRHLAGQGWVGFNANYRLSPKATFPDHLVDLKRAVAFIRDHADEYGIDPGFIVVTGGSAGGHLATLLALTAGERRFQPGFEDADTSIQAAVPFYGVYDFGPERGYYPPKTVRRFFGRLVIKASPTRRPEAFRAASAFSYLRPDAPPFFVVHGALDTLAPVRMARDFAAALRATSCSPVVYLELAGAQHAFDVLPSIRTRLVVRAVDRYLAALWVAHRQADDRARTVTAAPT
jgi:acetyl esterase/lipase